MASFGLTVGTRSLLYGIHTFWLHPWFVAIGWWKLYGFPWDLRLWVAFFVHDLGYWGKPNMDGPEGETHPELGARIMRRLFGPKWGDFTLLHSRFYARRLNRPISRLCVADKYATLLTPAWFYIGLSKVTGELWEYMEGQNGRTRYAQGETPEQWFQGVRTYLRGWVAANR